jgi:putative transposase
MGLAHSPSPRFLTARNANPGGCCRVVSLQNPSRPTVGNPALRHQLGMLHRSVQKRSWHPSTGSSGLGCAKVWPDWRSPLIVVQFETVITWHRKGFCLFWAWKVRHGQPGRPSVPRRMRSDPSDEPSEPNLGRPRIHGELRKLGLNIAKPA